MRESQKYRRKSEEFAGKAAATSLSHMKTEYLVMAAAYKRLADNAEQRESLLQGDQDHSEE